MLYYTILYNTMLYYSIVYYSIVYYTIVYYTCPLCAPSRSRPGLLGGGAWLVPGRESTIPYDHMI